MPGKIFISYRRDDAKAEARSIYQHLAQTFGEARLFIDVDTIPKGLDFAIELENTLNETGVLLAVIGKSWLNQTDEMGDRRLDNRADYVRREIAHALQRGIPVIPVRVDGASMPSVAELPDDLSGLARRQGTIITHENFESDMRGLAADLRQAITPGASPTQTRSRRATSWTMPALVALTLVVAAVAGVWLAGSRASGDRRAVATPAPTSSQPAPAASQTPERPTPAAAAKSERASTRAQEIAAAWSSAQSTGTVSAYIAYLRANRDADNRAEVKALAEPLLRRNVEAMLETIVADLKRPDGSPSFFHQYRNNNRAIAFCIDWNASSPEKLWIASRGAAGGPSLDPIEERERQALAFCQSGRREGSTCSCQITHRNHDKMLQISPKWLARHLD